MKKFVPAVIMLALCSLGFAQTTRGHGVSSQVDPQQEAAADLSKKSALAGTAHLSTNAVDLDCAFTFTSGAGNTFLSYCVTRNGNIVTLVAPEGRPLMSTSRGEGYGICDLNTQVSYSDYAGFGDTGNWQPSVILGSTAHAVKIARTTSDGFWTLTQTITQVVGIAPSVRIAMVLKNNTRVARHAFLVRYADVDAGGALLNNFAETINSAFGWNSLTAIAPFGLTLQNLGTANFRHFALVSKDFRPPVACLATNTFGPDVLLEVDGSLRHVYDTFIPQSGSLAVTLAYKGL
jgi:hypothetical protein